MTAALLWFIAAVIFGLMEAGTVSLVTIWFACGSLIATLAAALGAPFWLQATLFTLTSIALLLSLRSIVRKHFNPGLTATNADSNIGKIGIVQVPIDNTAATGQVKLAAMDWSARSADGSLIPAGAKVRVERIEGVKLIVTLAEETAEII
ncbi:MAG: NfeD family protein [Faecousia sp.]